MGNNTSSEATYRRRSLEEVIQHSNCYKELEFTWNKSKHGRCIKFEESCVKAYGKWGLCIPSSLVICEDKCMEYEFEIKIKNNSHGEGSSIMMGFIYESLIAEDNINYDANLIADNDDKQFIFQIGYGKSGLFKFFGPNKSFSTDSVQFPCTFCDDDSFKLRVNFKNRNIELHYNEQFVAVIFDNLPLDIKLIPCVALKNAQIELLVSNHLSYVH